MQQPISLKQVRIDQPCEMPWNEMRGNDRARFCEKCQLHVHNLSAMTSADAAELVDGRTDRMCVAYVPTAQGAPVTLDYEKSKRRFSWRWTVLIGLMGASVVACAQMMMGVRLPGGRPMIAGAMRAPLPRTVIKGSMPAPNVATSGEDAECADAVDVE